MTTPAESSAAREPLPEACACESCQDAAWPQTKGHDAATERGFVIERYVYTNRRGNDSGVQWLVHEERDGNRHLVKVCKTRREAKAYVRAVL